MNVQEKGIKLTKVTKRPPVDIEFKNLTYKIGNLEIIHSVNGKLPSGKLIGILGASGAGKTSLLNILAGQIHNGVTGNILINDHPREMKKFHKLSSYIMQEDLLQPLLTVKESMNIAAKLKLGKEYTEDDKQNVLKEVVDVIGLDTCLNVRVENLSGGQRRRLSIALELVNNPPVLFLDEPTTGLDNVAMKTCVQILKSIALQGRTVICTIHQPSDSLFKLFDMVYFMSSGSCIYNGTVSNLVNFLENAGFPCPITYSPADYIIELVQTDHNVTKKLSTATKNGAECFKDEINKNYLATIEDFDDDFDNQTDFPNSFFTQFFILFKRMLLQLKRNKTGLFLQFGHHIFCGLFLGILFYNIGNSGSEFLSNVKLFYGIVVYFMFTHIMAPILLYPFEVKILQREYFNRWYSLKAYFTALTIAMLPIMIITTIIFLLIAYPMTGQPIEIERILWFCLISLLMAITSQGFGFAIGSLFSPMIGACVGSALSIPLILLGMYGVEQGEVVDSKIELMMSISFPYHAFVGLSTSILNNRGLIECETIFCYFSDPNRVLKVMGMSGKNYQIEAGFLICFLLLHRVFSYFCLRVRLTPDHPVMRYIKKLQ
ncbi:ATP-binding cassette subfamily G member 4-like [Onthophagus taurus]|uniref:ATP-binding cassette subfamily G member 4-like n=1 Tax=Onthophagus taurus TaxID=166361 RepID=UPI000C1FF954|nr:ATP-binding cassette sub-family G member 4-like [Onthophagus taurus]